jgi:hypothetical protein
MGGMTRLRDVLTLLAVAAAVPGATLVRGQVPKAAPAPAAPTKQVQPKAKPAQDGRRKAEAERKEAVLQKRVVRARRFALPLVAPGAVLDAQAAQYLQQFRPLARGEYYLIKNVCEPNAEQRKQLASASEQAARGAARKFVEAQQKMMQGGFRPGMTYPDPHTLVADEMARVIGFLSIEQQEKYRRERELRAAGRKQVFIDNFVAKLDAELVLTPQQRDKLAAALAANWNDSWGQSLEVLSNLENFFPNIPEQVIAPLLTEKQQAVWRRFPRNQGVFFGFSSMAIWDPDPLDDPELVEARKAAEAKDQEKQKGGR